MNKPLIDEMVSMAAPYHFKNGQACDPAHNSKHYLEQLKTIGIDPRWVPENVAWCLGLYVGACRLEEKQGYCWVKLDY